MATKTARQKTPEMVKVRLTKAAGQTGVDTEVEYRLQTAKWFVDNDRAEYVVPPEVDSVEENQDEIDSDSQ